MKLKKKIQNIIFNLKNLLQTRINSIKDPFGLNVKSQQDNEKPKDNRTPRLIIKFKLESHFQTSRQ